MVERVLTVREVRGSIPGLGRFRVRPLVRNVQHHKDLHLLHGSSGWVCPPPLWAWSRELGDLCASSPICLGACTKYDLYNFWYDRRRCGPLWRIDRDEYRNEVYY